jgi:hypothetical protein
LGLIPVNWSIAAEKTYKQLSDLDDKVEVEDSLRLGLELINSLGLGDDRQAHVASSFTIIGLASQAGRALSWFLNRSPEVKLRLSTAPPLGA